MAVESWVTPEPWVAVESARPTVEPAGTASLVKGGTPARTAVPASPRRIRMPHRGPAQKDDEPESQSGTKRFHHHVTYP